MTALMGKSAVVTGGARGIGRAIVERLARQGATVVFSYAHNGDSASEVEQAVADTGGEAYAVYADFAESGSVHELLTLATDRSGELDIIVNNAAFVSTETPLADLDEELYDQIMAVNAKSAFLTMRHAARHMRDGGRLINISTINTDRPMPGGAAYIASKAVLEQLAKVAAIELGPRGITVNTVSPGVTDTDMTREVHSDDDLRQIGAVTPLGGLGEASDIADVVAFLAGPGARWVTGQNIRATGGLGL